MSGRYLRRKGDGLRDPTMTHVDDPHVFKVGDCIRDYEGWSIITKITDNMFGNPDIRFATMEPFGNASDDVMLGESGWHDFRPLDAENFHQNSWAAGVRAVSEVLTPEEARIAYESALSGHMTGFVP